MQQVTLSKELHGSKKHTFKKIIRKEGECFWLVFEIHINEKEERQLLLLNVLTSTQIILPINAPLKDIVWHSSTLFLAAVDKYVLLLPGNVKSYTFERPVKNLKLRGDILMATDDRNSAHLYKVNASKM